MFEKEEEIFQVWVKHPFAGRVLKTACGKELRIVSPGSLNRDSGPDFFGAHIEIGGQAWVGNIEIHVRASDWKRHGHARDGAFENVILHVVADYDEDVKDAHGNNIPVLVLDESLFSKQWLRKLGKGKEARPYPEIKTVGVLPSLETLGIQRLNRRADDLAIELGHLRGDVEALFHRHLFRRFGMRTNSEPFQQLAHRVQGKIIRRQRNKLDDLEALLYGQSGLLPHIPVDAYSADLLYRYVGLKSKYSLEPMNGAAWKFMRMRPSNFPTIRVSQLAVLLNRNGQVFQESMDETGLAALREMFELNASAYWDDHFRFGVYSGHHSKRLGEEAVNSILINAVALLRYFIGKERSNDEIRESALDLLRMLPAESNKLIRESGKTPSNALESQGVLEFLTRNRGSNDEIPVVSEMHFPYFSRTNHEQQQLYWQDRIVVRNPRVRRLRLVG